MQINLLEIAGFQASFKAMRLPMRSGEKSDSRWYDYIEDKDNIIYYPDNCKYMSDRESLFKNGFPLWNYDDGYNLYLIGEKDLKLAQSLILKGDEHSKFIRGIEVWLELTAPWYWFNELDTYVVGTTPLSSTSSMHIECRNLTGEALQAAKGAIRGDYEYTRIRTFNYQTLRRIYYQRINHRLPEWKQFCSFIDTLPLANELIKIKKEPKNEND
jgi:hypothetical protein